MWFCLALLYAIFIAFVIVFDKFTILNVFSRPLQGMFITIPTSIVILIAISPIVAWPTIQLCLLAIFSGFCLQSAQACYFIAMKYSDEVGDLSALESAYPILVAGISIPLGLKLNYFEVIGIFLIAGSITAFTWNKKTLLNKKFLGLVIIDTIFLSLHAISVSYILHKIDFLSFYAPYSVGIVFFGILPFIISKTERLYFLNNLPEIIKILPHLSLIEIGNILALISATYALSIGHPAIVTAVMSIYPAIVFILCYLLSLIPNFNKKGFNQTKFQFKKIIIIFFMSFGLGLLAKSS